MDYPKKYVLLLCSWVLADQNNKKRNQSYVTVSIKTLSDNCNLYFKMRNLFYISLVFLLLIFLFGCTIKSNNIENINNGLTTTKLKSNENSHLWLRIRNNKKVVNEPDTFIVDTLCAVWFSLDSTEITEIKKQNQG